MSYFSRNRSTISGVVGRAPTFAPSTRVLAQPGGQQTLNIFGAPSESDEPRVTQRKASGAVLGERTNMMQSLIRQEEGKSDGPMFPGGKKLDVHEHSPAAKGPNPAATKDCESERSSTRVMAAPGGKTSINLFSSAAPAAEEHEEEDDGAENRRNPMKDLMQHTCEPEAVRGFKTARINEESAAVEPGDVPRMTARTARAYTATSEEIQQSGRTARTARVNQESASEPLCSRPALRTARANEESAGPAKIVPSTSRTGRPNEETDPASTIMASPPAKRFAQHNKMMRSSVFRTSPAVEARSSTRVHHAPGGGSSNIFQ